MNKNTIVRIFLFLLLISVGLWWGFAAAGDDYGPTERNSYIGSVAFLLLLNLGNYVADQRRGNL